MLDFIEIYKLYNHFSPIFNLIEKINNNLKTESMIQDNCMDIEKDFYTSFENSDNGVNFFFNSKIKEIKAMLNDSLN